MAQYQAVPPPPAAQDPGRTLGIVGLILAFFCSLIGMIISIVAYRQSAQAGYKNNIALAGIIICAIWLMLIIVVVAWAIVDSSVGGSHGPVSE